MKTSKIAWGLFFVAAAALIILNQTGIIGEVSIMGIIISLLLLPVIVSGIKSRNFFCILVPAAFIAVLFDEPLSIEKFTPWPLLACAVFLSIGLHILFPAKNKWKTEKFDNSQNWQTESSDGEHVCFQNRFAGSVKYVTSKMFKDINIRSSFGGMKVYFDNAEMYANEATAVIVSDFSGIELYVPKEWTVVSKLNFSFGGIDEKGEKNSVKNGKTLFLEGNVKFAGITVIYV